MALECNALGLDRIETPITGFATSFLGFCKDPYTGPRTEEQSIAVARRSFAMAATWSDQGKINPVAGLSRARIYLFTALKDEIVPYDVMNAVYHFYADNDKANLHPGNITLHRQFPAHHTMASDNYYSASPQYVGMCNLEHTVVDDPYIGDCKRQALAIKAENGCDCAETSSQACPVNAAQGECHICQSVCAVDLAGAILMKLYPDVQPTSRESLLSAPEAAKAYGSATRLSAALSSKLVTFSQSKLIEGKFGAKDAGAVGVVRR